MPTRVVLFDFDGVLADTENIHIAAWQRTLAQLGFELDDARCARSAEVDDRLFLREFFEGLQIEKADVEGWVRKKQTLVATLLEHSPRLYPGVSALVHALAPHVRLGIVTTTWRENVEIVLRSSGLDSLFQVVIGKEDVKEPKPAPDGYLLALKRLGIEAEEAVALEDSPTGVAAAQGAGLRVLAIGHRRQPGEWSKTSEYLEDLADMNRVMSLLNLPSLGAAADPSQPSD